tara:strand:+ start:865 stop:1365 length:501 start_codon:yes stop_codon:yes gene_type:complete
MFLVMFSGYANALYVLGDINQESKEKVCSLPKGDTVVLASDGGSVREAFIIGDCMKELQLKLVVVEAYSAAPLLGMLSPDVCIAKGAKIGLHAMSKTDGTVMSKEEHLEVHRGLVRALLRNGIPWDKAILIGGIMVMTPHEQLYYISDEDYANLLGDNFKGFCDKM